MLNQIICPDLDKDQVNRIGFVPDVLLNVVGVSFDGRQEKLARANAFCTKEYSPPCYLELEPDNSYDSMAIAVYLGTDYGTTSGWSFEHIGYIPKGYKYPKSLSLAKNSPEEPGHLLWSIMNVRKLNVKTGVEGIYKGAEGTYGLRIGIEVEAASQ